MEKSSELKIWKRLAVVLAGMLAGIMAAMMAAGGAVSLKAFLQPGRVCDFSESALTEGSSTFQYDARGRCFTLLSDKAVKKLPPDGAENSWAELVVTVDRLSVPELPVELRGYDRAGERIYGEQVLLVSGRNAIRLNPEILLYRIGFYVEGQEGAQLSFSSMQLREKPAVEYSVVRFWTVAAVACLLFLCVFLVADKRFLRRHGGWHCQYFPPGRWAEYAFSQFDSLVNSVKGRKESSGAEWSALRLAVSLLFFWCMYTSLSGWNRDEEKYRYQVLGCMVLLAAAGRFCGCGERESAERKPAGHGGTGHRPAGCGEPAVAGEADREVCRSRVWKSPAAYFWMALWTGTIVSDFFAGGVFHFYGYGMLLAGGYFIFRWTGMKTPRRMYVVIADALEIVFFVSILLCAVFRPKLLAVQYNGLSGSPEENAMFAVLLLLTFALDAVRVMCSGGKGGRVRIVLCSAGMALAGYLVLRAENQTGYVAAGVPALCLLFSVCRKWKQVRLWLSRNVALSVVCFLAAALAVAGFHAGIKVLPEMLGTAVSFEDERKLSAEPEEILLSLAEVMPEHVSEIVPERKAAAETEKIRKAYVRGIGLFGNGEEPLLSGEEAAAGNGYLYMAYRYGIFILIPFVLYQLAVLGAGVSGLLPGRGRSGGMEHVWTVGVMAIYIAFCLCGNAQIPFGHPLWLCVYVGAGLWFL